MSFKAIYVLNTYTKNQNEDVRFSGLYDAINNFVIPNQKKYAKLCNADYVEIKDNSSGYWASVARKLMIFIDMAQSSYDEILFLDCDIIIENIATDIFTEHQGQYSAHKIDGNSKAFSGGFTALEHQGRIKDKFNIYVDLKYMHNTCAVLYPRRVFEKYAEFLSSNKIVSKMKDIILGSGKTGDKWCDMSVLPIVRSLCDMQVKYNLDQKWNTMPESFGPYWKNYSGDRYFTHYAGTNKMLLIERYKEGHDKYA